MNGKIIFEGSRWIFNWLAARWELLLWPREVKTKRQLDNVDKVVDVAVKAAKAQQDMVKWKIECYRELGLSNEEIKEKLMPDIEKETDPLSVIAKLAKDGVILRISELPKRDDSAGELPELEG